jgi:hypothetical protein
MKGRTEGLYPLGITLPQRDKVHPWGPTSPLWVKCLSYGGNKKNWPLATYFKVCLTKFVHFSSTDFSSFQNTNFFLYVKIYCCPFMPEAKISGFGVEVLSSNPSRSMCFEYKLSSIAKLGVLYKI